MAADLERLAQEFEQRGFSGFATSLQAQAQVARDLGAPEQFPDLSVATPVEKPTLEIPKTPIVIKAEAIKIYPEILFGEEWQRQVQGLIKLGFHTELNLTEEKYLESLPKFTSQPESFKGRLNTPVLVEIRISPKRQSELAGIQYFSERSSVEDWDEDPKKYKTPDSVYTIWTDEGERFMNRKVQDVREGLAADERGGTVLDGIALCIAKPDILQKRFLALPGTSVKSSLAAFLDLRDGRPTLFGFFADVVAPPGYGSLVCGR